MNVQQIETKLIELDFFIKQIKEVPHGHQIQLGCGANINIYSNGTILVQGKLIPEWKAESLSLLRQVLPRQTRWNVS